MNSSKIKELAREAGFDVCGITKPQIKEAVRQKFDSWIAEGKHGEMKYLENFKLRAQDFWSRFPDAKSVVVMGVNYYSESSNCHSREGGNPLLRSPLKTCGDNTPPQDDGKLSGRIARYAWGKDYHRLIEGKLKIFESKIRNLCGDSVWFEACVDTKPIFERHTGQQAGLGFIGKQTQLLSLQFGPWLFLSELITNLDLEADEPHQGSCGTCRICIDECPTQAIEAGGTIDARKCIAYLTIEHKTAIPEELRPKIQNWVFGCDECLNVCPYTAKQKESSWNELKPGAGFGPSIALADLFEIQSQKKHEEKFESTAILRAKRKQLLRNACVVLGNSKNPDAIPVLEKALSDSSELVREHAAWAIQNLKKTI